MRAKQNTYTHMHTFFDTSIQNRLDCHRFETENHSKIQYINFISAYVHTYIQMYTYSLGKSI